MLIDLILTKKMDYIWFILFKGATLMLNSNTFIVNKDELTLEQLKELLSQKHNSKTVMELMRNFCLQSTSMDIQKKGMEFLYINGFHDELQLLIRKNRASNNTSNREWAEIYQILADRRLKLYSPHKLLQTINRISTSEPELLCLIEFVKVTAYYDLNQFNRIGNFLDIHQYLIEAIEDRLLVSYFNMRLNQILLSYYLIRNEIILARKYAYRILNQTENERTKANTHIKLGLSYTFDTYSQGMYHLSEALKIARENNLLNIIDIINNRNIPFLSAHFNKLENITTNDISEQAHIEIAKGNNARAIELLNELPMDSPFQLYYMGKVKQDKDLLLKSYKLFIGKRSDYFFSRLPLNAIRNMNA